MKNRPELTDRIYFITLCAYQSQPILGKLSNAYIDLTEAGRIVNYCWLSLPDYDPHIQTDTRIIMPTHFHGILIRNSSTVQDQQRSDQPLSTVIRTFKAAATRRANHLHRTPGAYLWQPGYHARLIKSAAALNHFRQYIENNPTLWPNDPLNPHGTRPAPFCPIPVTDDQQPITSNR